LLSIHTKYRFFKPKTRPKKNCEKAPPDQICILGPNLHFG